MARLTPVIGGGQRGRKRGCCADQRPRSLMSGWQATLVFVMRFWPRLVLGQGLRSKTGSLRANPRAGSPRLRLAIEMIAQAIRAPKVWASSPSMGLMAQSCARAGFELVEFRFLRCCHTDRWMRRHVGGLETASVPAMSCLFAKACCHNPIPGSRCRLPIWGPGGRGRGRGAVPAADP